MVTYAATQKNHSICPGGFMKKILFSIVMTASLLSQAALLTYEAGDKKLNDVVLNKTASVVDAAGKTTAKLDLLGAGLRVKTVLVVEAKVYTLQLFSDNKAAFKRDATALNSLVANSSKVALKLDMLRTVTASSLSDSLKEALAANGFAIDSELTNVLAIFSKSAEATQGKSISVLLAKDNGKTNLYFEDTKGALQSMVGSPELMNKVLAIWLGKPVDAGVEKLKAALLVPVY